MNTIEYMGAVKQRLGIHSDYALAKELGISKQAVSRYAQGKGHFDDFVAIRVADRLGIDPLQVIADVNLQRADTPEVRAVWASLMEKISKSFLNLLSGNDPRRYRVLAR